MNKQTEYQCIKKLFIILMLFLFFLSGCSEKKYRRVLIVHSYEESYAAYPDFNEMIAKEFERKGIDVDIRTVYLDCESYMEIPELNRMRTLLDSISRNWKPEVILVNEDQATYSLLKCDYPLVKEVPVVFGGVNYPNFKLLKEYPNVTGFRDKIGFWENISMAKKLFGDNVRLFTPLDSTFLDRQIRADAQEQLQGKKVIGVNTPNLKNAERELWIKKGYTLLGGIPVRSAEKGSDTGLIWALSKYLHGQCYIQLKRDYITANISNISISPSLTAINEAFGYGEKLLGGYLTTLPIQVKEEVDAAARILRGVDPFEIPITDSRKEYVVDWNIMKQLRIPKNHIPSNYAIINIPFHEEFPIVWLLLVVTTLVSLVTLFIVLSFLYIREQKRKRRALTALADEKETLALAIEGGGTYVWKLENNCFIFEHAFWKSQGMRTMVLSLSNITHFIHPSHMEIAKQCWKELPEANKKIVQLRCDFNGKGYRWWEFRYTTTLLSNGSSKTAGLLLDIQVSKDYERELEEARQLAEKAELKQSFLANMSHEIRTPLNAIVGFSNILAADEDLGSEERQDYIDTINRNSELLLKLINDILELSRIESGYMSFSCEKCLVSDLVDSIYMTHQMLIPAHLQFLKEPDIIDAEINVDRGRLTQVITNFINNASKFTDTGFVKLGYRYISDSGYMSIYVEDTGRGIPREEQKMIFSRFYKRDEFSQGAGFGLSICQIIIEKLNGKIELWSESGKGSRFIVLLPCKVIE